ncbi:MAG: hypothetical protein CMO66_00515 [Verrucomicrobiales bacterium]|nr:hypothetical protein [Verrucomicrobiales bacterium]
MKRRDFLKTTAAAVGATALPTYANLGPKPEAKVDTVILCWMAGGMASTETFDPKKYTPFKKGLKSNQVLSTFPAIDTVVDNIKICQGFEHVAKVMDRGTLIRTQVGADLGFILHSRHQYHWHTGYEPPLTVAAPHIGAWIAHARGRNHPALPAFIDIGQTPNGESEEIKAFQTGGCLGTEFSPFTIDDPANAIKAVRPPAGMSPVRFKARYQNYLRMLKASPSFTQADSRKRDELIKSMDEAFNLLSSPAAKAFDLSLEPEKSAAPYGQGKFGRGCLLARRLCEVGARFIEVTSDYGPFKRWDTHENGHTRLTALKKDIDQPLAQLVLDLEERGLLKRTLIVLATEFSRDMLVEGKPDKQVRGQVPQPDVINDLKFYGMHRHFTAAGSVLMLGGGVQQGHLYGKTADERPCKTIADPATITDIHATILQAMGIPPTHHVTAEQRPFYATKDGKGKPLPGVLA